MRRRPTTNAVATLALVLALGAGATALADPRYPGPLLYGLDPVLRTTRDPRLLGIERLVARQRLLDQGIDPLRGGGRPTLESTIRQHILAKSGVDLRREVETIEANGFSGLWTEFRYPDYFFLFQNPQSLPDGFAYTPPRRVDSPELEIFVDDLDLARARRWQVSEIANRAALLDVAKSGQARGAGEGLLNLTIPIKIPRTLEKIIGRGEKTNVKITGREHIALSGESTVSNQFTPTERVKSQSLFPELDMEQQLQVNLSGQIGEKIRIEVDHNSEVIGPEGTKIKLSYQGDEDEIIQSIESGDVGLTLPGSQLLGYSSNKSGLFGIKVTGRLGRADFTVVTSKQKAESASKAFNSKGGEVADHTIESWDYLNNRFFVLDLPPAYQAAFGYDRPDVPGRNPSAGEVVDFQSIKVYRFVGGGIPQATDVQNVAAAIDTTGRWDELGYITLLQSQPDAWVRGLLWRPVDFDVILASDQRTPIAIDLRQEMESDAQLAIVYTVIDAQDRVVFKVGDRPGIDAAGLQLEGTSYYRMKLLKPMNRDPHTFQYVLRNFYSLGGTNIDQESFELRIERNQSDPHPDLDENGIAYIRIFGLDQQNAQGQPTPDGIVDKENGLIFDLNAGLLKFPLGFKAFAGARAQYEAYADTSVFAWDNTFLANNLTPEIYEWSTVPSQIPSNYNKFRLVASHAAASSSFNLGTTNIEEGSETVTLDGRALTRGTDYEIDYTFGQITLKGEAANLTADSQIAVNYQYAPFFGGGQSSLLGLNLGFDLAPESKLTTTWLYESKNIVGHKAKLGEEPSKNIVGNLNLQHTFRPYFLTHVANALSRRDSEKESTLNIQGEVAISIPNPNTKGNVYLEDFEGIESSDVVSLTRLGWYQASRPAQDEDPGFLPRYQDATGEAVWGDFTPESRVPDIRWFLPQNRVLRRYLNPALREQERDETQQALDLRLQAGPGGWTADNWGGIMRGISRTGLDLTQAQFLEFWINDFAPENASRRGKLHIDFGEIDEDFFWPLVDDTLRTGTFQREDVNGDGVFTYEEDVGLDGVWNASLTDVIREGAPYNADFVSYENPFPNINRTARNNTEDTEDINNSSGNTQMDSRDAFYSVTIDLRETDPEVDVLADYATGEWVGNAGVQADLAEMRAAGIAWRKYRVRLGDVLPVNADGQADLTAIKHVRIWFEDDEPSPPDVREFQLADLGFLGSRWERDGLRRIGDEDLLSLAERGNSEEFFLGEVNNKENPDYSPPFPVHEENRIPEKEQSLVLDFTDLEPGHVARVRKQVSPLGDDYTRYDELTWYCYNPNHQTADLDVFFRVGSDTLNFYEVGVRFADTPQRTGWMRFQIGVAQLANAKNDSAGADGIVRTTITDKTSGQVYPVRVVGAPDLRRIKRYYFGVANNTGWPVSGKFYLNDIILEGVQRKIGLAEHIGTRLNMADVIKVDFDWSRQDAEFHGLSATTGQGYADEDWNLSTNFRIDDFLPTVGFQLPVSFSRSKMTQRPKYITNSDIEILDDDTRNQLSTLEERESFSVRLSRQASRAALLRYTIDPWSFQLNGSRTDRSSPLDLSNQKTLQGSVNYDLRIPGDTKFARVPLIGRVPLLKGLSYLPSKISASANFSSTSRDAATRDLDGVVTPRPSSVTRTGTLQSSVDYQAFSLINIGYRNRSERDMLREQRTLGINIGQENRYQQDLQTTFEVPKPSQLPGGPVFWPLRQLTKGVSQLRPSLTFNGGFVDVHDPNTRQAGDPPDIRSVSNSGDWELRGKVPLGDAFKKLLPDKRRSDTERQRMIDEQGRLERERARGGRGRPGGALPPPSAAPGDTTQTGQPPGEPDLEGLTPEERLRRDEERLLQEAERRRQDEEEEARQRGEPPAAAPADTAAAPKRGMHLPNLARPVLGLLRGLGQVQVNYTDRSASTYARLRDRAPFWYRVGLERTLSEPDSLYASSSRNATKSITLSTNMQLSRRVSLDVKFAHSNGVRDQSGRVTEDYSQEWPDLRVAISGLERWGIFGGGDEGTGGKSGWFKTSSADVSYKDARTVSGYSDTYFNPQNSTTITPRWSFTLQSGMTVTVNGSWSSDDQLSSGAQTLNKRWRAGVQVRHDFKAQGLLAKLGLYRPGNQPTITMDVDLSYQTNRTERVVEGSNTPQTPTGQNTIAFSPRFSYQISRALSGALRLNYNRNSNIATNFTTTTFGLGLEATFVF